MKENRTKKKDKVEFKLRSKRAFYKRVLDGYFCHIVGRGEISFSVRWGILILNIYTVQALGMSRAKACAHVYVGRRYVLSCMCACLGRGLE